LRFEKARELRFGARLIRAQHGKAEREERYMQSNRAPQTQHRGKPRTFEEHPRIRERIEDGKAVINRYGQRNITAAISSRNTIRLAFKRCTGAPHRRRQELTESPGAAFLRK
jgi:broad specificity phosphatase PhoE